MTYSTKQVMAMTDLSKDALRYYEQIGILNPVARDKNRYRMYSEDDVTWLQMVKLMRSMGVKAESFIGQQGSTLAERRVFTAQYQQEVRHQIEQLQRIDRQLTEKLAFLDHLQTGADVKSKEAH
ncbi:MerR family transcriptional regulator [Lacticaseibacillus saniviri]